MSKTSVLIVEDERIIARDIETTLKGAGYAVHAVASSGEEAIALAGMTEPDVVLMDIVLRGGMDGIEAAGQIRARFGIPIIYLTAYADKPILERARHTEPIGYVLKPFSDNELLATIELTLHQYTAQRQRSEEALRLSEERFASSFEYASIGMALIAQDGHMFKVNPALCDLIGYSAEELMEGKIRQYTHPEDVELDYDSIRQLLAGDIQRYQMEKRFIHKNGNTVIALLNVSLVRDPRGAPLYFVAQIQDITERKQADEALRASEEKFRQLVTSAPDAVFGVDRGGKIVFANVEATRLLGYSFKEFMGQPIEMLVPPDARDKHTEQRLRYFSYPITRPMGTHLEITAVRKDGSEIPVDITLGHFKAESDTIAIAFMRDITERRQAEQAVRQSEARLKEAEAVAQLGHWELDLTSNTLHWSDEAFRIFEVNPTRYGATYEFFLNTIHPEDREFVDRAYTESVRDRTPYSIDHRLLLPDGRIKFVHEECKTTYDEQGNAVRSLGTTQDITARKRAEEETARRANEFAALYNTARELSAQHDLPALLLAIAERARALLGASGGAIYLYDPVHDDLEVALAVGVSVPAGARLKMGEGMAGRVAQTRQPLIVDDYRNWEARSSQYDSIPFRAIVEVPMLYAGELIGVLLCHEFGESTRKFSEADAHLLSLFAEYAASAVQSTRLMQTKQRHAEETSALLHTSQALSSLDLETTLETIGNQAKALFAADGCRVFLMEPDGESLRCVLAVQEDPAAFRDLKIRLGEGVTGAVAASGQAEIVNEMQNDPRAVQIPGTPEENENIMFAPLKERDRVIGVLSVRRLGNAHYFDVSDLELLKAFASLAASAVTNARMFDAAQRQVRRLASLHAIDMAISSSTDLRIVLDILLAHIITQLNVDAADILLLHPELNELQFAAGQGFHRKGITHSRIKLGDGYAGAAALRRHVVSIHDLEEADPPFLRRDLIQGEHFVVYDAVPLIAKGQVKGILEIYHRKPFQSDPEWLGFLDIFCGQAAIAIDNAQLFDGMQRSNLELIAAYDATITGWSHAMDLRDKETEGHTQRVTELTVQLAQRMGVSQQDLLQIRRGALLHDIGKLGVPDNILHKSGPLTDEEWKIMRLHPVYAYNMLSPIEYLRAAIDIPYCHHENWDGTGYPRGLKGEEIPLAARIFAIVDVWDALMSERPYRPAWTRERIIEYIREQSGQRFDPRVVDAFATFIMN